MNYTTLTCILCASSFNPQYSTYSINGRDRLFRKDRPFHSPHHWRPYSPRRWEGEYCNYLSTYVYFRTTRLLYHYEYSYVPSYPYVYCIESQHSTTFLYSINSQLSTLNSEHSTLAHSHTHYSLARHYNLDTRSTPCLHLCIVFCACGRCRDVRVCGPYMNGSEGSYMR